MTVQLPLPLHFPTRSTFDQFWSGGNEQLVHSLRTTALDSAEPFLFLWGPDGSGKSHLLQAACHLGHQHGRAVSYLPMRELSHHGTEIFEGLEDRQLVCIDDLDRMLLNPRNEYALFALFNELRVRKHSLAVSARTPPTELPTRLPDLGSRLSWGMVFRINPLDDENTQAAIHLFAQELGLDLPPKVSRYLMVHCNRDFTSLRQLLSQLDNATLAAQRKLTIPFIKQFLEQRT